MSVTAAFALGLTACAALWGVLAVVVSRNLQRSAARYAHEMRAALAGACIVLEAGEGLEPGVGLSADQRSRIALGELRRAGRLMRSLEEEAGHSLPSQLPRRWQRLLAALRRRRIEREGSFEPREETQALVHVWRMMARAGGRRVRFDWRAGDRAVLGRRDHFVQALSNLMGNALLHGAGEIAVQAESNSSHLRITVTDQGGGLPRPLAKLTSGRSRHRHGHGLPVAAWAVRRLGGRMTSAPAPLGARIVIELPLENELLGDGSADWYTRTRAEIEQIDRERAKQQSGRVIPLRRQGPSLGGAQSRARGSHR